MGTAGSSLIYTFLIQAFVIAGASTAITFQYAQASAAVAECKVYAGAVMVWQHVDANS